MKRKIGLNLAVIFALSLTMGLSICTLCATYNIAELEVNTNIMNSSDQIYNDTANTVFFEFASGELLFYDGASGGSISSGATEYLGMMGGISAPYCVTRNDYLPSFTPTASENLPTHTHDFVTGTIYDATCDTDGLEGTYCKTCGFIKESSPISAFGFTLEKYAQEKMDAAKSGQTIVLEFGTLNSFPKTFMEKIAAKVASGVSFEFRYKWNNKLQKITIPAYSTVDTNLDWYGPATMEQLYGAN